MNGDLTITEAALVLGVSTQTLRRWDASGRLKAVRRGTHRRYRREDLERIPGLRPRLFRVAYAWASASRPLELPEEYYCPNSAVFQARLHKMETIMGRMSSLQNLYPLIVAVAGEIGNNSFDHNLGNWPDVPGVFFAYDLETGEIVLADRGVGVFTTLRRALPDLHDDREALTVAFSEVVSGRKPEARGNGLKFVRQVITDGLGRLFFQSGDTILRLKKKDQVLSLQSAKRPIRGCLARIRY